MNYYELIYLKQELNFKLLNCKFHSSITPHKDVIEFYAHKGDNNVLRLVFSTQSQNPALFYQDYRPPKKSNSPDFFTEMYERKITSVSVPESDRWLYVHFEGKDSMKLNFRLFGHRINVFLSEKNQIVSAFKETEKIGSDVPEPKELKLFDKDISEKESVRQKLISLNPMIPREHLDDIIKAHGLQQKSDTEILEFIKRITSFLEESAVFRLLKDGSVTLFNDDILPLPTEKYFDSVNDLIGFRFKTASKRQRLLQKKKNIQQGLETKKERLERSIEQLSQAEQGLERADKYEKYGHLLMTKAHINTDESSIEVEDFYEGNSPVTIELPVDGDIAANAEYYYDKAKGARKSYEQAQLRIPKLKKEKEEVQALLEEMNKVEGFWEFMDWEKEVSDGLDKFLITSGSSGKSEGSPYHQAEFKGYTIWIGKNAKSNDRLTQEAHKEDIWLHARGVPGSHTVIRMGNTKEYPPKDILLEAASYAAYNSKARGAKLVPVIVTKKKYVRKPKGSATGAVVVDKENVEMVEPKKPDTE